MAESKYGKHIIREPREQIYEDGELRFDGFQEQGLSSLFRKKYGFGSGAIWKKILTFSRRLFGSSTSKTSFEKLTSAMTPT